MQKSIWENETAVCDKNLLENQVMKGKSLLW